MHRGRTSPVTKSMTSISQTPSRLSTINATYPRVGQKFGLKERPLSPVDVSCAKRSRHILVVHPHQASSESSPVSPSFTRSPSQSLMPTVTPLMLLTVEASSHYYRRPLSTSTCTNSSGKLNVNRAREVNAKHARPNSKSPGESCTVDYQLLPSPPVFAISPYDPEFGNKVYLAYRCHRLSHYYRKMKYGQDIAREYRPGYTPEEIKHNYLEEQRRVRQEIEEAIAASDSDLEETVHT
ncbi:hypothetical protein BDV97DRAFT_370373 [Delphinella strobiligena]|nr:hypothetical protein BDV97DRAFT_370373 [Delphinella strobiligena]